MLLTPIERRPALTDILLSVACAHDHGLVLGSPMMTPYSYAELLAESGPVTPELVALAAIRLRDEPPIDDIEIDAEVLRVRIRCFETSLVRMRRANAESRLLAVVAGHLQQDRDALTALLGERAKGRAA